MIRRPPGSTRTYTLFPYTTLFRSVQLGRDPHHEIAAERPVGRKPFLGAKREVIVNAVAEGLCQFIGRGAGESHHVPQPGDHTVKQPVIELDRTRHIGLVFEAHGLTPVFSRNILTDLTAPLSV